MNKRRKFWGLYATSYRAGHQNIFNPASTLRARDQKLTENWYIACLSRELGQHAPLKRVIYDEPVALYRDRAGRAHCLKDQCAHRASELSQGEIEGDFLRCPYHGWKYDAAGTVCEVPSERNSETGAPSAINSVRKLCVRSFPCVEQDGCVWIYTGAGQPAAPPPFRFPISEKGWDHYFMITDFENEVTNLAENYMDVPHTVFVHRGWFRSQTFKRVPIQVDVENGSVLVTYDQPEDSIGFTTRLANPKREKMFHTDRFISPNITKVDYRFGAKNGFAIISQITPVSQLRSRVYTFIGFRLGPSLIQKCVKPFISLYTRQVIEQDVEIMAIQKDNLQRDLSPEFKQTDADVVHLSIEHLRQLARENPAAVNQFSKKISKVIWI